MNLPKLNVHDEAKDYYEEARTTIIIPQRKCPCAEKERMALDLTRIKDPIGDTAVSVIEDAICKRWHLTSSFMYSVSFKEVTKSEASLFYYFEAVFSQPSAEYPIPIATCTVLFRLEVRHTEPPNKRAPPMLFWRMEGQHCEFDARFVDLSTDAIFAMLVIKLKFFKRIEKYQLF